MKAKNRAEKNELKKLNRNTIKTQVNIYRSASTCMFKNAEESLQEIEETSLKKRALALNS